jgi:hypothetical protein
MAEPEIDGCQAFADDDEDRIAGLDMRWDLARAGPRANDLRDWRRDAEWEARFSPAFRAAIIDLIVF